MSETKKVYLETSNSAGKTKKYKFLSHGNTKKPVINIGQKKINSIERMKTGRFMYRSSPSHEDKWQAWWHSWWYTWPGATSETGIYVMSECPWVKRQKKTLAWSTAAVLYPRGKLKKNVWCMQTWQGSWLTRLRHRLCCRLCSRSCCCAGSQTPLLHSLGTAWSLGIHGHTHLLSRTLWWRMRYRNSYQPEDIQPLSKLWMLITKR